MGTGIVSASRGYIDSKKKQPKQDDQADLGAYDRFGFQQYAQDDPFAISAQSFDLSGLRKSWQ
jgi:hypothetical protein